jgi:hypothetical protein
VSDCALPAELSQRLVIVGVRHGDLPIQVC